MNNEQSRNDCIALKGVIDNVRQHLGSVRIHDCMNETTSCNNMIGIQQRELGSGGAESFLYTTSGHYIRENRCCVGLYFGTRRDSAHSSCRIMNLAWTSPAYAEPSWTGLLVFHRAGSVSKSTLRRESVTIRTDLRTALWLPDVPQAS